MNMRRYYAACQMIALVITCGVPSLLPAQGIDLGKAFKPALEAMARQMEDMLRRRLAMNPEDKQITVSDSAVTITVTNNYEDSARTLIKVHKTPPPATIKPLGAADSSKSKPKRSLVAKGEASDTGVVYKDLAPWVTSDVQEFVLGPGESKTITVSVRIPADIAEGEYAAWIGAHVVVGKSEKLKEKATAEGVVDSKDGHSSYKVAVQGIPTSVPEGTQIISFTKLVVKK